MKLNRFDSPHIRHANTTRTIMLDVLFCLLALYVMAYFYHGPRALLLGVISTATAYIADIMCSGFRRRPLNVRDLSALVTGMILPLLMPASIPIYVVVTASLFAIFIAKHPFGGAGYNVFNPAAAGFSFVAICFPELMFTYPAPRTPLSIFPVDEIVKSTSPAFTLSVGGVPKLEMVDMLLGNFTGPMGATNILVLVACLLYLLFRGTVRWEIPFVFLLTTAVFSLVSPLEGAGAFPEFALRVQMMHYELMSGFLLFGCIFLLGDPVTTPKRSWSKIAFAFISGIIVMLFRRHGNLEEGFSYAILLMNATVWGFDMLGEKLMGIIRQRSIQE